jgi:type I restriction enzyme S subunit
MNISDWEVLPFESVVSSRGSGACGLPQKEWLEEGLFPVIGQGTGDIEGWTNREDLVIHPEPSLVLYGGHTRRAKHVVAPFVAGPNVKILVPSADINSKFLYYFLNWLPVESKGYADHFPLVRKSAVPFPNVGEQRRIVAILDEALAGIATAKANAEGNLQNAREMFDARIWSIFNRGQQDWPRKTLREIATDFGRGKSKHRPRNDPALYGGPYPFIQTGEVRNSNHLISEYSQTYSVAGLAQSKLWPQGTLCITIAANIAETGILGFAACFPDSVIGVVADPKQTSNKYLEYMLQSVKADLKAKGKGSAQDNINLGTFENERLPFPDLATQSRIVEELDAIRSSVADLESIYTRKLTALDELKQSLLHQAFSGQL